MSPFERKPRKADDFCFFLTDHQLFLGGIMLVSLALMLLLGFGLSGIFKHLKLPGLIGLIIAGIILGPNMLNMIHPSLLSISSELRQIALIVILLRAGLSLDINDLIKVGRPALLMSFLPAVFEMSAIILIAPIILKISVLDAAILGAVFAAVSPAVVVPRMLHLMQEGYGKKHRIPQIIMAGASLDDIFVIVLFTSFISLRQGQAIDLSLFISLPISILTGIGLGVILGWFLVRLFKTLHMRDTIKVLLILSLCFLLVGLESKLTQFIPYSALLSVISIGLSILYFYPKLANRITSKFSKIWVASEVFLFILVGAVVNLYNLQSFIGLILIVLILGLISRFIGVQICLIHSDLTSKEKIFTGVAYIPKATVQAAIGSIPLSLGFSSGNIILASAVLAILVTAPLGAIGIDVLTHKLLNKDY